MLNTKFIKNSSISVLLVILSNALVFGLFTLTPWIQNLEENIGLDLLFHLRGEITPPNDTIIIAMDRSSAKILEIPEQRSIWPRKYHTRLVQQLDAAGAKVIVFDILFKNNQTETTDNAFSNAIKAAGNVILFEYLDKDVANNQASNIIINKQIRPIQTLEQSASATATFPLPKIPFKVSQYWKFTPSAGDSPSLPAVALQIYLLDYFPAFISQHPMLSVPDNNNISFAMKTIRQQLIKRYYPPPLSKNHSIESLALSNLYNNKNSEYLNFYGEAQTINTISYSRALSMSAEERRKVFHNKAIFIGASDNQQWNQYDSFHTTFTNKDGLDISGVEIAATAFSNLLESNSIKPVSLIKTFTLITLWGTVIAILCATLPAIFSLLSIIFLSLLYLTLATIVFTSYSIWLPIVMPLLIQTSLILLISVLYKNVIASREKNKIIKTFTQFIPENEIKQLLETNTSQHNKGKIVSGVILFTDIVQYTSLSESLFPEKLSQLINQYHQTVFSIIHQYGGLISDAKGDSVLAIWPSEEESVANINRYTSACHAALDISLAIDISNTHCANPSLPTRIGLHCGEFHLGIAGSKEHYEYRTTGDCINTSARITSMNKHLGTKILTSEQVLKKVNDVTTRTLGRFKLAGKENPINLSELISKKPSQKPTTNITSHSFSVGLELFRKQQWQDAKKYFSNYFNDDPAATFYIKYCDKFQQLTLPVEWDGSITMKEK